MRHAPSICLLVWFCLLFSVPAWAEVDGITEITKVEGITEYALDNGLQILLFPDPSQPTITVNMTYRVGSRHEGRGEAGMAHLLEHMVFKGTPTYPNIWGALEDHGASFNGTTWVDRTNYYETLPASDKNLKFAIRMEADRMINSLIAAEELAKDMTVVRNEFEMGENSPVGVLSERMFSAAYLWHNYGKSTIGNRSDIERVPADNLRKFYQKYYQPDNATLLVAGRFDPEQALALIKTHFGSIPRPDRELEQTYTEEPAQDGARLVTLKRVGDVAAAGLVYHIPAGSHPEFPAIEVLTDILTDQPSGHLYRKLVVPGFATGASGNAFGFEEPGLVQFQATVETSQSPEAVLDYMIDTVE
ncbi:MAG: pitrilysin family protein, partial [Planctomycetota bacterium]